MLIYLSSHIHLIVIAFNGELQNVIPNFNNEPISEMVAHQFARERYLKAVKQSLKD